MTRKFPALGRHQGRVHHCVGKTGGSGGTGSRTVSCGSEWRSIQKD